jgi:hypothetical protein
MALGASGVADRQRHREPRAVPEQVYGLHLVWLWAHEQRVKGTMAADHRDLA